MILKTKGLQTASLQFCKKCRIKLLECYGYLDKFMEHHYRICCVSSFDNTQILQLLHVHIYSDNYPLHLATHSACKKLVCYSY